MSLNPYQQVISAQIWVCDACGCQDNKSCGCDSTAHAEDLAAKREAHRQANRRSYEKAQQNQQSSDNPTSIDNIEEFPITSDSAENPTPINNEAQQERDEAAAERNKQETLFRLSEAAYRGTVAWSVDDFAAEVRERLADKVFRKQFQDRLRIDHSNIPGIQSGAKVLADVLTQLLGKGS